MEINDYLGRHGATHETHGEDDHKSLFGHGNPIEYNQYQVRNPYIKSNFVEIATFLF